MEGILWQLLASSRGADTRVRLLQAIEERPRNPNQLAEALGMDYTTITHHLRVLEENNVVTASSDDYGAVYLLTDQVRAHWDTVEEILETVSEED
jgi:DNA-binding transcriptional ArsR family regulator